MEAIKSDGWKPEKCVNTIYGTAVYLSRGKWCDKHDAIILCQLTIYPYEVKDSFEFENNGTTQVGSDREFLIQYLKQHGIKLSASTGLSKSNLAVRDFFVNKGIKAIKFQERGTEVVAVYDPNCIQILGYFDNQHYESYKGLSR